MPLADDIAHDYAHLDALETLTYTPRNQAGEAVPNVKGLRRVQIQPSLVASPAALPAEPLDTVWHVWAATLGGAAPQNGDTLTDAAGTVWTILELKLTTLGTRYRALCRRQAA